MFTGESVFSTVIINENERVTLNDLQKGMEKLTFKGRCLLHLSAYANYAAVYGLMKIQ